MSKIEMVMIVQEGGRGNWQVGRRVTKEKNKCLYLSHSDNHDTVLPTGLHTCRAANAAVAFDSAAPWEMGTGIFKACGTYWALARLVREII
jgi:hypothetical protein